MTLKNVLIKKVKEDSLNKIKKMEADMINNKKLAGTKFGGYTHEFIEMMNETATFLSLPDTNAKKN